MELPALLPRATALTVSQLLTTWWHEEIKPENFFVPQQFT